MRLVLFSLTLLLLACGGDAASESDATPARTVSDSERQRLTTNQLAALLSARVGRYTLLTETAVLNDESTAYGEVFSSVGAQYSTGDGRSLAVYIADYADAPGLVDRERTSLESDPTERVSSPLESFENRREGDALIQEQVFEDGMGGLGALVADRFMVSVGMTSSRAGQTMEDIRAFWQESGLAEIGSAPLYADAGPDSPPAWMAQGAAEGMADPEPAVEDTPAPNEPLASCDAILPVAEVERICSVAGLRVFPTDFETEGENCNRKYVVPGNLAGLILLVSRYESSAPARGAVGTMNGGEYSVEHARIADLGDGGVRWRDDYANLDDAYTIAFSVGPVLAELTSHASNFGEPTVCAALAPLETLARGVAGRLDN